MKTEKYIETNKMLPNNFPVNEQTPKHADQLIDQMTLMDDILFGMVFDGNKAATELLLKIILKRKDIHVITVVGQREFKSPITDGRRIRLDILSTDSKGHFYNFEVQRSNEGATERRARLHSSMIDSRMLKKGQKFKELNDSYVIFITEKDYFKRGLPVYTIHRHLEELEETFHDGSHILYVNGSYNGTDELGKLMHDFRCQNVNDMQHQLLAESVKYFKESKGGQRKMSGIVEQYANEKARQAAKQAAEKAAKQALQATIKMIIENGIEDGIEKDRIIERLCKKCSLTVEQAEAAFEEYAPVTV